MTKLSHSLLFTLVVALVFFDSYIYEIQLIYFPSIPLLIIIRALIVAMALVLVNVSYKHIEKMVVIYFCFIFLYVLSGYLFTADSSKVSYYLYNLIYGFIIYYILSFYLSKNENGYYLKILGWIVLFFVFTSVYIELYDVERYKYQDAIWQCGSSWNTRLCGATKNPNALGILSFLVVVYAITLYRFSKKKWCFIMLFSAMILALMAMSRTSLILGLLLCICFSVVTAKNKKLIIGFYFLIVITASIFIQAFGIVDGSRFTFESLSSASGRVELFSFALNYVNDSVIFGNGLDFQRSYVFSGKHWNNILDNAFLNYLVSYGILGLIFFLALVFNISMRLAKISQLSLITFLVFIFMQFAEDFTFKGYFIWFLFALVFIKVEIGVEKIDSNSVGGISKLN